MAKKPTRPRDANKLAKKIVDLATVEAPLEDQPTRTSNDRNSPKKTTTPSKK